MKFLICPDSFKDSMTATAAAKKIAEGIRSIMSDSEINIIPLSDGGQGFLEALLEASTGEIVTLPVKDPLGKIISASFGLIENNQTAIIEIAQAAGLERLRSDERNPYYTSSYGVGELIKAALSQNVSKIIIGLGGSATNDGGAGMLQALGAQLQDANLRELKPGCLYLKDLEQIKINKLLPELNKIQLEVACDVNSPLTGPQGASAVYGPQKGATADMINGLDHALENYLKIIEKTFNCTLANVSGGGAAGGLATALLALGGRLCSGIELMARYTGLEQAIATADYVISGEGAIDVQTSTGKTISGIAKLCQKYGKPLIILTGRRGDDIDNLYTEGITAIFTIGNGNPDKLENILRAAPQNLFITTQNMVRLIVATENKNA